MENNGNNDYITQLFERMYNLSKSGNQGPDLLKVLDETKQVLEKKIAVDNWRNDPNRALDTFDAEHTGPSTPVEQPELEEFGTPENKGFGSM